MRYDTLDDYNDSLQPHTDSPKSDPVGDLLETLMFLSIILILGALFFGDNCGGGE